MLQTLVRSIHIPVFPRVKDREYLSISDKSGEIIRIGAGSLADFDAMMEMYSAFSPKPASQGVPPEHYQTCHQWITSLFEIGKNVLAWRGENLVGHSALVPDRLGSSGEFMIFVHQFYRHLGVGTGLTRFTLEMAQEMGFTSVWLMVPITNFAAVRLYRKFGFLFCDTDPYARTMILDLRGMKGPPANGIPHSTPWSVPSP